VHFYDGNSRAIATASVRIYCGESSQPVAAFGPVTLHAPFHEDLRTEAQEGNDFWFVADVFMHGDGCDVRALQRADGTSWIEPETDAIAGLGPPPP
jgi:hypothetical protein